MANEIQYKVSSSGTLNITGVSLLDDVEAAQLPEEILECGHAWWLKTPGTPSDVCAKEVSSRGIIQNDGYEAYHENGVRPALSIEHSSMEALGLKCGDEVTIKENKYIVIPGDKLLSKEIVGATPFCNDISKHDVIDYETSDVRSAVNKWALNQGLITENQLGIGAQAHNTDDPEL